LRAGASIQAIQAADRTCDALAHDRSADADVCLAIATPNEHDENVSADTHLQKQTVVVLAAEDRSLSEVLPQIGLRVSLSFSKRSWLSNPALNATSASSWPL